MSSDPTSNRDDVHAPDAMNNNVIQKNLVGENIENVTNSKESNTTTGEIKINDESAVTSDHKGGTLITSMVETLSTILPDTTDDLLSNLITGINIIDGMLFWTDGVNEPRKINIETQNRYFLLSTNS